MKKKLLKRIIGGALISALLFNTTVFASGTWSQTNGKWTYTDSTGTLTKGWISIGGKWYYFDNDGIMATGWQLVNGIYYYLNPNGDMKTGWLSYGGKWYYFNTSGQMVVNSWAENYYLGTSGYMLINTTTPDGYVVGSDGRWDGQPQIITYKTGDTVTINDSYHGTYELTINNVQLINERNQFWDTNPPEVYKITYTYKLLSKGTDNYMGLYIDDFDSVVDSKGEVGELYPGNIIKYPKELLNIGDYCTAEAFIGVNNVTDKLVISKEYYNDSFQSKYVTFVVPTK